jgi:hypothetical protein
MLFIIAVWPYRNACEECCYINLQFSARNGISSVFAPSVSHALINAQSLTTWTSVKPCTRLRYAAHGKHKLAQVSWFRDLETEIGNSKIHT